MKTQFVVQPAKKYISFHAVAQGKASILRLIKSYECKSEAIKFPSIFVWCAKSNSICQVSSPEPLFLSELRWDEWVGMANRWDFSCEINSLLFSLGATHHAESCVIFLLAASKMKFWSRSWRNTKCVSVESPCIPSKQHKMGTTIVLREDKFKCSHVNFLRRLAFPNEYFYLRRVVESRRRKTSRFCILLYNARCKPARRARPPGCIPAMSQGSSPDVFSLISFKWGLYLANYPKKACMHCGQFLLLLQSKMERNTSIHFIWTCNIIRRTISHW